MVGGVRASRETESQNICPTGLWKKTVGSFIQGRSKSANRLFFRSSEASVVFCMLMAWLAFSKISDFVF